MISLLLLCYIIILYILLSPLHMFISNDTTKPPTQTKISIVHDEFDLYLICYYNLTTLLCNRKWIPFQWDDVCKIFWLDKNI